MKVYGIFRGFPGLGRVMSGLALLDFYAARGSSVKVATYGLGISPTQEKNIDVLMFSDISYTIDISSMGIIPVSRYGENIIEDIKNYNPDLIIVDGEPLMIETLSLMGYRKRLVALANKCDIDNPSNVKSSQVYFKHLYEQAGIIIVHGLGICSSSIENISNARYVYTSTIVRNDVLSIKFEDLIGNEIVGVLGGGQKTQVRRSS